MLVLLIILPVATPLLTVGVQVDLQVIQLTLFQMIRAINDKYKFKGEIYIQEHQVTYQKMVPKLLAIAKNRTDTRYI